MEQDPRWSKPLDYEEGGEIVSMSAADLASSIRQRKVSCVEVMSAYLDAIERLNPRVNAIVSLRDRGALLSEARGRDVELTSGHYRGCMHGLPQAVKDLAPTKGIRTTQGSLICKDHVPQADAIFVERMKRSGAILIGKTNTSEFGLGSQTYNSVFGTTLNAYDPSRTAGGSSGGAAVAVALRMLPVADGSDNAGSIRNPAAFNNLFGLRPSLGRVPSEGRDICLPTMGVVGCLGRTVQDVALLLSVQAGYHASVPGSLSSRPDEFTNVPKRDFKGARIGWLGDLGGHLAFEPGVLDVCQSALRTLESIGCRVEPATPDYPAEVVWRSWTKLRHWQTGAQLKQRFADPTNRALIKPEAHWEVQGGLKLSAFDIYDASVERAGWYRAVQKLFERYEYLALPSAQVFPFQATTHWPRKINGRTLDKYHRGMEVVVPVTMAGCPAISIPAGFDDRGLPMGLQIWAPHQADLACLELALAYEEAAQHVIRRAPGTLQRPHHRSRHAPAAAALVAV